jgi:hypothetical protein
MAPKAYEPSAQALANAAERSERARLHAQVFVAQAYEDMKKMARELINELLVQMFQNSEFAMFAGHSADHYQMVRDSILHVSYMLGLVGPGSALPMAQAYDVVWSARCADGCEGHAAFFKDAGLEALFLNCIRTIQDAIGMCMIRDGELQQVMSNERLSIDTASRLRNAFLMQKRYLNDVGNHLKAIAEEGEADHSAVRNAHSAQQLRRRPRAAPPEAGTEEP